MTLEEKPKLIEYKPTNVDFTSVDDKMKALTIEATPRSKKRQNSDSEDETDNEKDESSDNEPEVNEPESESSTDEEEQYDDEERNNKASVQIQTMQSGRNGVKRRVNEEVSVSGTSLTIKNGSVVI